MGKKFFGEASSKKKIFLGSLLEKKIISRKQFRGKKNSCRKVPPGPPQIINGRPLIYHDNFEFGAFECGFSKSKRMSPCLCSVRGLKSVDCVSYNPGMQFMILSTQGLFPTGLRDESLGSSLWTFQKSHDWPRQSLCLYLFMLRVVAYLYRDKNHQTLAMTY